MFLRREQHQAQSAHVVIIGCGIMGAMTAYQLSKQKGVAVTCIEKEKQPATQTSGNSFGWINGIEKTQNPDYFQMCAQAVEIWQGLAAECSEQGYDIGCAKGGSLFVATNPESAETLKVKIEYAQQHGYKARILDDYAELKAIAPGLELSEDKYILAAHCDDELCVDPALATVVFKAMAGKNGVTFMLGTSVTGFNCDADNKITSVKMMSNQGEKQLRCDYVVLAAGNGSPALAEMLGVHIPLVVSPGVITQATPNKKGAAAAVAVMHILSEPDADGVTNHHLKQNSDGRLVMGRGTQSHAFTDDSPQAHDKLLQYWRALCPSMIDAKTQPVVSARTFRVMPEDSLPIYGCDETFSKNCFFQISHSGVTLAPWIGHQAVQFILGKTPSPLLDSFSPQRFNTGDQTHGLPRAKL